MKIIVLLMFSVCISFVEAKSLTLNDLKMMALKNNYGLKSKKADLKISEINMNLAKSSFYPRLGVQAGKEWINSDVSDTRDDLASVYGEINLFNGFRDSAKIKERKINARSAKNDFENSKFELSLQVENIFYRYLYAKEKLSVISDEIARTKAHSRLVKKRYSSKLLTESDIIEFQLHQKKTKSMENYLRLEKEQLFSRVLSITGSRDINDLSLRGKIPHLKIESSPKSLVEGLSQGPSLRKLELQEELIDIEKKSANSGWYPSVNLRAEYGKLDEVETGISSNETSSRIGLMATWEFFSGFETSNKKELQKTNKFKIDYSKRQVKQDLTIFINSKFKALKMLEETIEFEEENEKLASKLYQKTLAEYKKGIKDSGALLDASQKITDSKNRVFELKLDYILTKLSMEKSLGKTLSFNLVHE